MKCCACHAVLQFTTEHYLIEGAREVIAAGSDSFKFNLANLDARGRQISVSSSYSTPDALCCCQPPVVPSLCTALQYCHRQPALIPGQSLIAVAIGAAVTWTADNPTATQYLSYIAQMHAGNGRPYSI